MTDPLKPGDKVKCYGFSRDSSFSYSNLIGVVAHITEGTNARVIVRFPEHNGLPDDHYFHPRQLEKLKAPMEVYFLESGVDAMFTPYWTKQEAEMVKHNRKTDAPILTFREVQE